MATQNRSGAITAGNKQFLTLFAVLLLTIVFAGCGKKEDTADKLVLYCGAGIRPPVQEAVDAFEKEYNVKVDTDYAGSETLASRIKLAQQGDLYMPGDKFYVDQMGEMISARSKVCYFVPTIMVAKGNPKRIKTLTDLLKPGFKIGVGDSRACAIGRKTKKILEKNGITWQDLEPNIAFQSQTVNELGVQIQAGSLDAVIVWSAVAEYYSEHSDQVRIPLAQNVVSTIEIGQLSFTANPKLSEKFVAFIISEETKDIFRRHNYQVELQQ